MAYQAIQGPSSGSSSSSGFQLLNSPFGDTTYTKVFVGGLAWETQSETMRRHFEQFGEILEAVVITDKNTGRSKGYGFVTFRDPEAARRACADPTPIIDGRRANCNLASLGRPRPPLPYGRIRPASPYVGGLQPARGAFLGSFGYQQPVSYGYQQGLVYPPYGYTTYGPEYVYPQSMYNPYMGQHYLQIYGVPGAAIRSCHMVDLMLMPCQLHLCLPFKHHILAELLHQFQANRNLLFLLLLHSLCKAVVLTKPLGEGANKVPLVCSRTRAVELLLEWRASNLALQVIILHSRGTFACFASSRLRSYIVMLTRLCISWLQMAKETGICGLLLFHLDVYISVFIPDTAITQKELW
ncbi:hypothetical protein AHAS_Ahas16G0312400 [Arachis hypogaea]